MTTDTNSFRQTDGQTGNDNNQTSRAGLAATIVAIVTITLLSLVAPDHDPLRRAVYELAVAEAVGVVSATIMRLFGYGVAGLLIVPLSVTIFRSSREARLGRVGAIALALSGIAWALLGVLPAQFGNETVMVLNGLIMLLFALAAGIALILLAFSLPWDLPWRLLLGIAGLAVTVSPVATSPTLPVPGLLERICLSLYFIGVGALSAGLVRREENR